MKEVIDMKKIITLLMSLISCVYIWSESNSSSISAVFEVLGSTELYGINIEYSPNNNLDFGFGFMPSKFLIPVEVNAYIRYDIFDYWISPYIELSSLMMLWQMDGANCGDIFTKIHTGIVWRFNNGFVIGLNIGYQFWGNDSILFPKIGGLVTGAFLGWKFRIDSAKKQDMSKLVRSELCY
jgi:hypothetical protein